ncbi:MAG: S-adenosylmethionine:tRNA ribosyltransferase-isomerase [Bacteroidetes bacterium]|nr:MAG: S-adenosylmethionine:tRNA ribosyltransferase-isomerase [Bacteroidota bacterium]
MPTSPRDIDIQAYDYPLPEERIAKYPLVQRDASKLLVYRNGTIKHISFHQLPAQLPVDSLLVFNNTRVIHARLHFSLPNGRIIEILCLEPLAPLDYQQNLSATEPVRWKCLIGGNRRWKDGLLAQTFELDGQAVTLSVERIARLDGPFEVAFSWQATNGQSLSFGEILAAAGKIPLPPYLGRDSEKDDADRYQTVYARPEGSVAAPTAGLHFTEEVFQALSERGVKHAMVTLHVGAGTFKPVSSDTLGEHEMHRERIFVETHFLEQLGDRLAKGDPIIAVGTTSLRTLESLYWLGVRILQGQTPKLTNFLVKQWEPYQSDFKPSAAEAIQGLLQAAQSQGLPLISGNTQLLIAPGYQSELISAIITNFHQPRSTLLLLIASLIGEDWRKVYDYALREDFRFLSYGDSSLLWKQS